MRHCSWKIYATEKGTEIDIQFVRTTVLADNSIWNRWRGCILVPILILVFAFHPKHAIALSNFTILGSAITNTSLNFSKRHPSADRPLVDWDLILVMEPLTAAGAIVGAYMSKVLPEWLLALMLVLLLGVTAYRTLNKGVS